VAGTARKPRATGKQPVANREGEGGAAPPTRRRRASNPGHMLVERISGYRELEVLLDVVDAQLGAPHGAIALLLYTWMKAHYDWQGRMDASPRVLAGKVIPYIKAASERDIKVYLNEMANLGLIAWYQVGRLECAADLRWDEEQVNLPDGAKNQLSHLPAPTDPRAWRLNVARAAVQPELAFPVTGSEPAANHEATPPLPEVKGEETGRIGEDRTGSEGKIKSDVYVARGRGHGEPPDRSTLPPAPADFGSLVLVLWEEIYERSSNADSLTSLALVRQLRETARIRTADPMTFTRALLLAYRELLEDAASRGEHHGSPTIAGLAQERWFSAALDWMDGKRPGVKGAAGAGSGGGRARVQGPAEPAAAVRSGSQL